MPPPATDCELETLRREASGRHLFVEHEYLEFLRFVNGFWNDGISFAGAAISADDSFGRNDFVHLNEELQWVEDVDAIYGSMDGDYFVHSLDGKFRVISGGSGDEFRVYNSFLDMMVGALRMRLPQPTSRRGTIP